MGLNTPLHRRLSARSVILSVLLGSHPAQAPVSGIVRLGNELGLQEQAIRVALTRMVAAGDLERDDASYRLAPRLLARQHLQDTALDPALKPSNGQWRLAVVTTGSAEAANRVALRESLRNNKFGQLREGVWGRPDNLVHTELGVDSSRLAFFTGRPDNVPELVERLFRPADWAATAGALSAAMTDAVILRDRLEIAAAIVRHILHDPILPSDLLPQPWPGAELRRIYHEFLTEFTSIAEHHIPRAVASTVPRRRRVGELDLSK